MHPVRAFPIQSHYSSQFGSPTKSLSHQVESNLHNIVTGHRPSSAGNGGYEPDSYRSAGYDYVDVDEYTNRGGGVPGLGSFSSIPQGSTLRGITRPVPVGVTTIPTSHYRPPSGTQLNKIPYSARQRMELAEHQRETKERLRAKSLDRKLRDALLTQELQQSRPSSASNRPRSAQPVRPKSASAKKNSLDARRHADQQRRAQQAVISQDEIALLARPYEPTPRPLLRGSASGPLYAANGKPIVQPGSARKSAGGPQWGTVARVSDGSLVSSSSQSRLSAADLASQPVAGMPSNNGVGNNLSSILGGGHEHVVFGQKNADSAQTRQQLQQAWQPEQAIEVTNGGPRYAPYATTAQVEDAPDRFNDRTSGAVMVRDELTRDVRHASACLGYGKGHAGYRDYVARPAAASGIARTAAGGDDTSALQNPFLPSSNHSILTWHTDGIQRGGSREQQLKQQQEQYWSRTSSDYGTDRGVGSNTNRSRPVAGLTQAQHQPLQLYYPDGSEDDVELAARGLSLARSPSRSSFSSASPGHVHSSSCGHSHSSSVRASPSSSNNNPLNPYTSEELSRLTQRPQNLAPSSIGFGKKHVAYKSFVLGAAAPQQQQ